MSTSAQSLVTAAFARDAMIDVASVSTQYAEVISALGRILRRWMQRGVRRNPEYFGVVKNVPLSASGSISGWARPSDAAAIYRIEAAGDTKDEVNAVIANGSEITVVPFDDRAFIAGDPAVYEIGGRFVRAGNAGDPASGSLNFIYAATPSVPAAITDIIDVRFPDDHADLLISDLNVWFAKRDGRVATSFEDAVKDAAENYYGFLDNATLNVTRRTAIFREIDSPTRREEG